MKIGMSGSSPASINSMRSTRSSCVLSTANDGMSNTPLGCVAARTSSRSIRRRLFDGGAGPVRIAIGGLKQDVIEVPRPVRVRLQELVVGSDIAGEQEARRLLVTAMRHLHLDGGRAEKMTRIPVAGAETGGDILPLAVSHAPELREGRDGVLLRVDG